MPKFLRRVKTKLKDNAIGRLFITETQPSPSRQLLPAQLNPDDQALRLVAAERKNQDLEEGPQPSSNPRASSSHVQYQLPADTKSGPDEIPPNRLVVVNPNQSLDDSETQAIASIPGAEVECIPLRTISPLTSVGNQISLTVSGNDFRAGRDNEVYAVAGNLTLNKGMASLQHQLKMELRPVETAAYDSYVSTANRRTHCFEGTRSKVLLEIRRWIGGEGSKAPIYLLDGVAGIGKSTVAQTVAEKAAEYGILGASFFFSRDEEERSNAKKVFPTIAFQLSCFRNDFALPIAEALKTSPDASHKLLSSQFRTLIVDPLRSLLCVPTKLPILIILDALDECDEDDAKTLLSLLAQYLHEIPQLKFFITSRPEWHIRDILRRSKNHEQFHLHDIEDSVVQSDIRLYLDFCFSIDQVQSVFPDLHPPWQLSTEQMAMLCGLCGTLFIIASTTVKFILDNKRANPEKQLSRLLEGVSPTDFSGSKHTNVMDKFYIQILCSACPDDIEDDDDWLDRYQVVVGTIVVLRNPLPCYALALLIDVETSYIQAALFHLHSLVAPSGHDMIFRVHHQSFPDFITSQDRIQRALRWTANAAHITPRLFISTKAHHLRLAKACLRLMCRDLRSNPANLLPLDRFGEHYDVEQFSTSSISKHSLAYACTHWASHLSSAHGVDEEIQGQLNVWAYNHIPAWLELMCVLKRTNDAYWIMHTAGNAIMTFSEVWPEKARICELFSDVRRMTQQSGRAMQLSPMQVHTSGFPFLPTRSALYQSYEAQNHVKILAGAALKWDPTLAVLPGQLFKRNPSLVAFASNSMQLVSAPPDISEDYSIRVWDSRTGAHMTNLSGHSLSINSLSVSSDGLRLASCSSDWTIRLWDLRTGSQIGIITGHADSVPFVEFFNNDSRLISASGDRTIRLWDGQTCGRIAILDNAFDHAMPLTFSRHGARVASVCSSTLDSNQALPAEEPAKQMSTGYEEIEDQGSEWTDETTSAETLTIVRLWDASTGQLVATLQHRCSNPIKLIELSANGSHLVTASTAGSLTLWDGGTGAHLAELGGHSNEIHLTTFSADGSRLAAASKEGPVRLWDTNSCTLVATLDDHTRMIVSISFSNDGSRLATASHSEIVQLWDGETGDHVAVLCGHPGGATFIAFSKNNSTIVSLANDNHVRLWNGRTGKHTTTLIGHTFLVHTAKFSDDSTRLVTASQDGTIRLWDFEESYPDDCLIPYCHPAAARLIVFSADDSRFALITDTNAAQLWGGNDGHHITDLIGHTSRINCIVFSKDSAKLASASDDQTICIWDGLTGTHISTLTGHSARVTLVTFSNNGYRIASAGADQRLRWWDSATGTPTATSKALTSTISFMAFSDDDSRLASASENGTVHLWDGQTCTRIFTLEHADTTAIFSGDGSKIAVASAFGGSGTIWLLNGRTGTHITTFEQPGSYYVKPKQFSPDGTMLLSKSVNGTIQVWNVHTGKPIGFPFENDDYSIEFVGFFSGLGQHCVSATTNQINLLETDSHHTPLLLVAKKRDTELDCIMAAYQKGEKWETTPFCCLPPKFAVCSLAVGNMGTLIAVSCRDGRMLLIDISRIFSH